MNGHEVHVHLISVIDIIQIVFGWGSPQNNYHNHRGNQGETSDAGSCVLCFCIAYKVINHKLVY